MTVSLSPAQQPVLDWILAPDRAGTLSTVIGAVGSGKTTVLRAAQAALGGAYLSATDFMAGTDGRHPLALGESFYRLVGDALGRHPAVFVDDLHLVGNVDVGHSYPLSGFLNVAVAALAAQAESTGKRLVFGSQMTPVPELWHAGAVKQIERFAADDYAHICRIYLGDVRAAALDHARIHRFARQLSATQLRQACEAFPGDAPLDTERFIEHLRAHHLVSNVDLGEVQAVSLHDLKGVDDVIRALEANVILPLENADLAAELSLKPKRGVLLAGPPGTGKTTVGRALAHRLRSKFFLIDGTVIAGTAAFYNRVQQIFEAAKQNAPAIIFIDDSDVIFENGGEMGLYRYLLTMLDGIESASAGRVCLVMTAMDVGSLPPALVRSGRIELWLEMRLPDESARTKILDELCAALPAALGVVDVPQLAAATEGLSGADLRRLVDDGKLLFAYDVSRAADGRAPRPVVEYFLDATETLRGNKQRYAEAEARARGRHGPAGSGGPPGFFDFVHAQMAFAGDGAALGEMGGLASGGGVMRVVGDLSDDS